MNESMIDRFFEIFATESANLYDIENFNHTSNGSLNAINNCVDLRGGWYWWLV